MRLKLSSLFVPHFTTEDISHGSSILFLFSNLGMRERVARCEGCLQSRYMKENRPVKAPLEIQPLKSVLWQKVHVDLTSKFGETDNQKHLIIAIDRFSKYIFAEGNTVKLDSYQISYIRTQTTSRTLLNFKGFEMY